MRPACRRVRHGDARRAARRGSIRLGPRLPSPVPAGSPPSPWPTPVPPAGPRPALRPAPAAARRLPLLCALLPALLLALPPALRPSGAAAAKDYAITALEIDARLAPDGGLEVSETRAFDFDGSFRHVHRTLPLREGVGYDQISVAEGGREYDEAPSGEPGTFRVSRIGDELEIRWHFRARDEARSFTVRYRVRGAVQLRDDAAVLYYQFVGPGWSRSSRSVEVRVHPPAPLPAEEIRQWWHGPLWASSAIDPGGTIVARCRLLPARTFLEARVLYPPALFPGAPAVPGPAREQILAEEARWAEAADRRREGAARAREERRARARAGRLVSLLLGTAGAFAWLLLYQRFGRRLDAAWSPPHGATGEDPGPAFVDYLMHGRQVGGMSLVATILDLARRGFLVVREQKVEERGLLGSQRAGRDHVLEFRRDRRREDAARLRPHEEELLRFLSDELGRGRERLSLTELKGKQRALAAFVPRWRKQVAAEAGELRYFDPDSLRGMSLGIAVGLVMIVLGVGVTILCGPWGLILPAAGTIVCLLSLAMPRRSPGGEHEYRRWSALREALKSAAAGAGPSGDLLARIDANMIYGLVLGVGAKRLRALAAALPAASQSSFPWYAAHGSFSGAGFADGFSSLVATAGASLGGAAGSGGGASDGGGGGGGGAGGGGGGAG